MLPTTIDRLVAARTTSRAIALVEGLRTGDAGVLAAAAGDELHEAPRSALTPTPARLMASARGAGAAHAAWSGAGPSVVAFADEDTIDDVVEALGEAVGTDGRAFEATIDRTGVTVE